jgi:hypothetical protein
MLASEKSSYTSEASPLTAEPELAILNRAAVPGATTWPRVALATSLSCWMSPSHVVQAALTALKSQLRGVGPVALRDMDALCIKDWSKIRPY